MTHEPVNSIGGQRAPRIKGVALMFGMASSLMVGTAHAQVGALCETTTAPWDAVRFRFNYCVEQNSGNTNAFPMIKIIFATFRVWSGVPGSPADYLIEANLYTSRWTYSDPVCAEWGQTKNIQGTETFDEASLRIANRDPSYNGWCGAKTFAPLMFPRQLYNPDGFTNIFKTDMMCQSNLNNRAGVVEIGRGATITNQAGWVCHDPLPDGILFRQWDVSVTIGGEEYTMALAVPNEYGQYLCPNEMPTLAGEFLANVGTFQVFYWGFEFQRENATTWEPVEKWAIYREQYIAGSPYGIRVVPYNGRYAMEISNTGGEPAYFGLGESFSIPRDNPKLGISREGDGVALSWNADYTGLRLEKTPSLTFPSWQPVTSAPMLSSNRVFVTDNQTNGALFYRLSSE